jgi:hypothetical protein
MTEYVCYGCNNCCYLNEEDMREHGMMDEWDEDYSEINDIWCPCGGCRT